MGIARILGELFGDLDEDAPARQARLATEMRHRLRHATYGSFDLEGAVPRLQHYTQLAARCLGHEVLADPLASSQRFFGAPIDRLQRAVRQVFAQYQCPMPHTKVRVVHSKDAVASVHQKSGIWHMDVRKDCLDDPHEFISAVAHEVAHIVLGMRGIELPDRQEDEELTDTVAVMGGFGTSCVRAAYQEKIVCKAGEVSGTRYTSGYLSPPAVAFLSLVRARMCGTRLHSGDMDYLIEPARRLLQELLERQAAPVSRLAASERTCVACASPLRIPSASDPGHYDVHCRVCAFPQQLTLMP